jgi:hypothetical protein
MKSSIMKVTGIVIIFLAGIGIGAGGLWLIVQNDIELRYYLLERPTGNQPHAQIGAFVQAIVRGERSTALELWEIEDTDTQSELVRRQKSVISDLVAAGISPDYMILSVEWWTTCCEPSVTCDSRNAGGARILVQFLDKKGEPILYTFDVFTREQPYWGSATGYPSRDWVIRDVYPYDQRPLFWPLKYITQTQSTRFSEP